MTVRNFIENLTVLRCLSVCPCLVCFSSGCLRFYTESDGPDPNMTPYYQSVPMAMWVTLLNLSGEAPLCDYTAWGKVGPRTLYISSLISWLLSYSNPTDWLLSPSNPVGWLLSPSILLAGCPHPLVLLTSCSRILFLLAGCCHPLILLAGCSHPLILLTGCFHP